MSETSPLSTLHKNISSESPVLLLNLVLKNFLSFGPQTPEIELGPLNVLIGTNGAGKSNLIEAIALLRSCPIPVQSRENNSLPGLLRRGGGVESWMWKGDPTTPALIDVFIDNPNSNQYLRHSIAFISEQQKFHLYEEIIECKSKQLDSKSEIIFLHNDENIYKIKKNKDENALFVQNASFNGNESVLSQRNDPEIYPEIYYINQEYNKIAIYREWAFGRTSIFRYPQQTDTRTDRLEEDFSNLGMFLNRLYGIPKVKKTILKHLKDIYEEVDDFHMNIDAGTVQIFFIEGDYQIPATRVSDGSLRYLCLLAILCDPTPPPLICLEEPELGLHPDILPKIADLLVEASQRTQLIVTTHSEIIVDSMSEHPEAILIVEKHEGQTEIKRVPSTLKPEARLGNLWLEGELGGTRW